MDLKKKILEAYGRNRGYAHGFASPHAPSLGGRREREDDEGWDREPQHKTADVPHAVHINGKKWKSFGSQSHAQNVAKKIAGATVHKEEVEVQEVNDYFKRRQREKDIDAGKPVKRQPKNPQNDYFARRKKEKELSEAVHRIGLTVTDPNHPMVSKRKETIQKTVRVTGDDREKAITGAIAHYKRKGYKVHDHHYIGTVNEAKDAREYDYEGDMAKSQLRAIIANAQQVHDMLQDDTNMAEWVQSKITLAADYISTVADYMQSEVKEESEVAEASKRGLWDNIHAKRKRGEAPAKPGDKDYPKTLNIEAMDREHPIAKEYQAMKQHDIKTLRNMIKGQQRIVDTSGYTSKDHAISAYLRHKHGDKNVAAAMGLKEEEMDTRIWEAWSMGKRDPQRGIKVGQQVRSYDFPGMHDDHYIEGHVVGETPHSYHIRTNKVVRGGKEVPVPAHMSHIEAPKGKGMFSGAYGVHKIMAKQNSVAAQPQAAQGAAKSFAAVRGKR